MLYLVAQYDKDFKISFPPGTRDFYEVCCALHYNYWPLSHGIYSDEQLDIFHERWCRSDARQVFRCYTPNPPCLVTDIHRPIESFLQIRA